MLKPTNYDAIKAIGEYTPIIPGGHHAIIKGVQETQTKTGKDMLQVAIDFAPGDSQPGYMAAEFASDIRPDKRWPRAGRQYIVVVDNNGNCSRSFKNFISCVEKSNHGFQVQWGDGFCAQFKGKRIGAVYGDVENDWDGKKTMRRELRWFCPDDRVDTAAIPQPRFLPNSNTILATPAAQPVPASALDGFVQVAGNDGLEEIPF